MKALLCSAAALALAATFGPGIANAQDAGAALGESSLQPMNITCADLTGASEEERTGLVFFIAGYQAAMEQAEGPGAGGAGAGGGAGGGTDTAGSGTGGTGATAGDAAATAGGAGATAGGGDTEGDVMVSRSFFAMDTDEILADCEATPDASAATVISGAQEGAQ